MQKTRRRDPKPYHGGEEDEGNIINWQNSNYFTATTGKRGEAGLWPEILREKLKT